MADIEVQYKGSTIKSQTGSGTVTLHTEGKYCEDDIDIVYVAPGGGGGTQLPANWTYFEVTVASAASNAQACRNAIMSGHTTAANHIYYYYCLEPMSGWVADQFISGFSIGTGTSGYGCRYRNNAIAGMGGITNQYDAKISVGDKYAVIDVDYS